MPDKSSDNSLDDMPHNRTRIYRHRLPIRLAHWANLIFLIIMLMSGLQIFNAHPALYIGSKSDFERPILAMDAGRTSNGNAVGITTVFGHQFNTTGLLGLSTNSDGKTESRGFPAWATLPSVQWLSMARSWHFFFAWLFVINITLYIAYTVFSSHLWRDLLPKWQEIRHLGGSILDHLKFRYPENESGRYNVMQKLAYLIVIFVLGPLVVLTGMTMSPQLDSAFPWLLTVFGGRQTARTIHFLCAFSFVGFFLIHVFMVLVSGVWNNMRSMLTGRYEIKTEP